MSDVAGAPAPAADAGAAPAPVALGTPSFAEAARDRLVAVKNDKSWGARYLSNDVAARSEMKALIAIAHGGLSESDQTTLASSIGLQRTPSVVAGERQREAAQAATDAMKPDYNYQLRSEFGSAGVASIDADLREWSSGLGLPATTEKTVLQRVAESGTRIRAMNPEQIASWRETQDRMLLGAAHNDHELVAKWKADAAKVLRGGRFTFDNADTLHDAFIVRSLAMIGGTRK